MSLTGSEVASEDSVRRGLERIEVEDGAPWLHGHLDDTVRPPLSEPRVLDRDTTIKSFYGHREGAVVSYDPKKPGRPSHAQGMRKRDRDRRMMRPVRVVMLVLVVAVLVPACGGGAGGGSDAMPQTTAPPPPPPPPPCVLTVLGCLTTQTYEAERQMIQEAHNGEDDFKNQWGLSTIRADRAWAQLELEHGIGTEPGSGQTVGVIDTGIDTGHPVFASKTVTEHIFSGSGDATGDQRSHGMAVASVIVGRPSAEFTEEVDATRGVAWGADVAMFAIAAGSGGGDYSPISLAGLEGVDDRWASRFNHVINWSSGGRTLDFVNMSVGFEGIIEQYSTQELRDRFGDAIAALAQSGATEKTVFIWAAGNAHGDPCDPGDFPSGSDLCVNNLVNAGSVEILPGLPARISELRGLLIAVVAVDSSGDIASFSNRCGIAAQWCIAAPGVSIRLAYFGPHPDTNDPGAQGAFTGNGTSYAAPMVTGTLVVMKHHFRDGISNPGLVSRLLETAYDSGIYADSATYGHGLLDLAAALSPQGTPRVALSNEVGGPGVDLTQTRLTLGNAFCDGLTQALAGREVAAFDELGAPFWYSLGAFTRSADGPSPAARLRGFMARADTGRRTGVWRSVLGAVGSDDVAVDSAPLRFGLLASPATGAGGGHLSLAGQALSVSTAGQGGLGVAAFSTEGLDGQAPVSGAALSWRPEGAPLGLRGGLVGERAGLLGSRTAGAFGRMAAGSVFAGIEGTARIGAWRLGAGAEVGTVHVSARGGLIAEVSPLTTSAFALRAERLLDEERGAFTLSLSQPLRVETGHAKLSVPVGRTKDGQVRRQSLMADLEPTGRQIEVAAQWRRPLGSHSELRLGATWTRHPGHVAAADPDLTLLAGWRQAL